MTIIMNKSSTVSYIRCLILTTIVYTLCFCCHSIDQSMAFVVIPVAVAVVGIAKSNSNSINNNKNNFNNKYLSLSKNNNDDNNNNNNNNVLDKTNKNRLFIQNRNEFIKSSIVGMTSTLLFVSQVVQQPQAAVAIVDDATTATKIINTQSNKRILSQSDEIAIMAAYRRVKNAIKKLQSTEVELFITNNDYTSIHELVRVIPFSEIRSSCSKLIKYTTPLLDVDATLLSTVSSPLEGSYKKFVVTLEKLDSIASLGIRGKKITSSEFYKYYQNTIVSLQEFILVTEKELFI